MQPFIDPVFNDLFIHFICHSNPSYSLLILKDFFARLSRISPSLLDSAERLFINYMLLAQKYNIQS